MDEKWDLTHMYQQNSDWWADLEETKKLAKLLKEKKGSFTKDAMSLYETAQLYHQLGEKLESLLVYAKMRYDQNMVDAEAKNIYESAMNLSESLAEQLAFLSSEVMEVTPELFLQYKKQKKELEEYDFLAEKIFAKRDHTLPEKLEELLANMNALGNSFEKIYDDLTVNDMHFESVKDKEGNWIPADNTHYQKALISSDREFRKQYFTSLLSAYKKHIHTICSIYYGSVKRDVLEAKNRKYPSSRAQALAENHIPEEVYDTLIQVVKQNTKPLEEYVAFRQQVLQLPDIHFYDLFVPFIGDSAKSYTLAEAQDLVLAATAPMGEEYTQTLQKAFANRWNDAFPAPNKATGAYSISSYRHHPYALLNFTGTLNDVFTLAHEMGHSMHSYFSNKTQPFVYSEYSIFLAEIASTVNERMLFHYLLSHCSSEKEKALLLCNELDGIRSTFYRQTMFADFENWTHKLAEKGSPLLPEELSDHYRQLNETYYGKQLTIDPELAYEWARIPHFYRPFYVYQYATGISAAIRIEAMIREENGAQAYQNFLSMGGNGYPIDLLKNMGIDMTKSEVVTHTVKEFSRLLQELKLIQI